MPTYTFYHEPSDIEWDEMMSNPEREQYLKDNPEVRQIPGGFAIAGDHIMGVGPKTDGGFNERMEQIANSHPGSPMADRFGGKSKSHKEIKTRSVLKKHRVI